MTRLWYSDSLLTLNTYVSIKGYIRPLIETVSLKGAISPLIMLDGRTASCEHWRLPGTVAENRLQSELAEACALMRAALAFRAGNRQRYLRYRANACNGNSFDSARASRHADMCWSSNAINRGPCVGSIRCAISCTITYSSSTFGVFTNSVLRRCR